MSNPPVKWVAGWVSPAGSMIFLALGFYFFPTFATLIGALVLFLEFL